MEKAATWRPCGRPMAAPWPSGVWKMAAPGGAPRACGRMEEGGPECILTPADGGAERKLADLGGSAADSGQPTPAISWNADGKSLVVARSEERRVGEEGRS